MNHSKRHSYYVTRTIQWLRLLGFSHIEKVETNYTISTPRGPAFVKRDLWGADILVRSEQCMAFIQVKTSDKQVSKGISQLSSDKAWPPDIGRFVVWWDERQPLAKGPNVFVVAEGSCSKITNSASTYRKTV